MLTRHAGSRSASGVAASLRVFHVPAMKWPAVLCARHNYNVKPSVFSLPPSFLSFHLSILRSGRCTGSKLPSLLPRRSPAQLPSYTHRAFRFINYFYSIVSSRIDLHRNARIIYYASVATRLAPSIPIDFEWRVPLLQSVAFVFP